MTGSRWASSLMEAGPLRSSTRGISVGAPPPPPHGPVRQLTLGAGGIPSNFAATGNVGIPLSLIVLGVCLVLLAVGYGGAPDLEDAA